MFRKCFRCFFRNILCHSGKVLILPFIFAAVIFFLVNSCTGDNACKQSRDVYLVVSFRTTFPKTEHDTTLPDLSVYGLSHSDSLLYDSANVSKVSLPLNPSSDSTGFVLTCRADVDTLMLVYTRQPHLISYECGFVMYYRLIQASLRGHLADSLRIIQSVVTTDNVTNINIYF